MRLLPRRWFGPLVFVVVAAVAVPGVGGCADSACALSCGSGVNVWWLPGDVPDAAGYNLCINGSCEPVDPRPIGGDGQYLSVSPARAPTVEVTVRLELLDDAGAPFVAYSGAGTRTGECCAGIEFRVANGELVIDQI